MLLTQNIDNNRPEMKTNNFDLLDYRHLLIELLSFTHGHPEINCTLRFKS